MKVIPQSAALYRAAVPDLNSTLHGPTERTEARALIAELLGRQVRIRQDGAAVFACLDPAIVAESSECFYCIPRNPFMVARLPEGRDCPPGR